MTNDTYTIIRELQGKNNANQGTIANLQSLCKELSDRNLKLIAERKKAVELLEIVEFKTNKRFEREVKNAIKILQTND